MKEKNNQGLLTLVEIKQLLISNLKNLENNLDTVNIKDVINKEIKSQTVEVDIILAIIKDEKNTYTEIF